MTEIMSDLGENKVLGFIVIASVSKEVSLPIIAAEDLYGKYGFGEVLPAEKKLSAVWERATNVSTIFRKDIELSDEHKFSGKKVRFYTSKIKSELGEEGTMTRHLVMEIVNPDSALENKFDLDWEKAAGNLANEQRINKPISIMKFNANDYGKKVRFYWSNSEAQTGYDYLAQGQTAKIIGEIKEQIELESGSLTNREIWRSIKSILSSMAAYPLTSRGSAYFVPVGKDSAHTRKMLKNLMDLVNELKQSGRSSCTIWQVEKNPQGDYFGSASEVLANSILELNDRIAAFAKDLTTNKRQKTLSSEWIEIQNHVALFKGILGSKLADIETSLKDAVANIQGSQYSFDINNDVTEVLASFDEIQIPELNLIEDKADISDLPKVDSFEIEIDF